MNKEVFKPISVKPKSSNPLLFEIRCLVDLQLGSIVKYLKAYLSEMPKGNILDIGAGESPWREWMPNGSVYFGIDIISSYEFGIKLQRKDITLFDGLTIPFPDGSFDGAICIEVLEHAINPEKLMYEAARVLKKSSPLLLTVPFSARRHHIPYDFHRFTKERLYQIIENSGFENITIYERGNDISAIASKLLVVTIRNLKSISPRNFILAITTSIFFGVLTLFFIAISHISMFFDVGKEDPLGYFCVAYKK
jgi:ubiquinone/menaquinone biosynthesis C-methylase UbiE